MFAVIVPTDGQTKPLSLIEILKKASEAKKAAKETPKK